MIYHRAWEMDSEYPSNPQAYLGVRGMFDQGEYGSRMDWHTCYERRFMVDDLGLNEDLRAYYPGKDCWWDRFRASSRSPFERKFSWPELTGEDEVECLDP